MCRTFFWFVSGIMFVKLSRLCCEQVTDNRLPSYVVFKGTGSRLSVCSLIKFLLSNLLFILSVNNSTHMYLSDLRVYFKVEVYFRIT